MLCGHYDNTLKYFTYDNYTCNNNKCDITYMFLFTVVSKVIDKLKSIIRNVT
jgi:hypothetical protein